MTNSKLLFDVMEAPRQTKTMIMSLFVSLLCQIIRWPTTIIGNHQIIDEKAIGQTAFQRTRHGRNAFWAASVYRPRKGGYVKRIIDIN